MRATNQRLAGLQHGARQPHFATKVYVEPDTKPRKRTDGAAAGLAKHGDSSSAWVDDGLTSLTSFGKIAELASAPEECIGDALLNKDAHAQKRHLPPMDARMLSSAADGLLPAGTTSTTIMTIFSLPPLSYIICEIKETANTAVRQNAR